MMLKEISKHSVALQFVAKELCLFQPHCKLIEQWQIRHMPFAMLTLALMGLWIFHHPKGVLDTHPSPPVSALGGSWRETKGAQELM